MHSDWRTTVRARAPETEGFVERNGVRVFYEAYGSGEPTILVLPTWSVLHAAHGRFQIADLARHYRVLTFDGRGNGRSDRPPEASAYGDREFVADALAVLDATETEAAVVIACSQATHWLVGLAAQHPDRILGGIASGTNLPIARGHSRGAAGVPFHERYRSEEGWAKFNAAYWRDHYEDFLRFFFSQVWTEPHSRKVINDCVGWGLETTPETLIATVDAPGFSPAEIVELAGRIRCPMLVVHGGDDAVTPHERGSRLAELTGGSLLLLQGAGHCSGNRDPVRFNLLVRDFVDSLQPRPRARQWTRAHARPRRVVFVPSSSGASVGRDIAIADALRSLRPGVHVEWLASGSARQLLEARGEAVHPASDGLVSESDAKHDSLEPTLTPFAAWLRMDEARFVNFMVFNDLASHEPIDLVIADGAWEIDHHLHENPELKRFAYAWLTDAVGWLPASEGGDVEALLVADANAEMIAGVERYPRIRDRAVFIGDLLTLPTSSFGAGLPSIADWTQRHFALHHLAPGADAARAARDVASLCAELL